VNEVYVVSKDIFTDLDVDDSFNTELTSDSGAVDFMVETEDKFEFAPNSGLTSGNVHAHLLRDGLQLWALSLRQEDSQ